MDDLPITHETHLGNPKEASEHIIASMGLSNALDNGIQRKVNSLPENHNERLTKINKMIQKNRDNISNQSDAIFNGGSIEGSPEHPKGLHPIHETIFEHAFNPQYLNETLSKQFGNLSETTPNLSAALAQTVGGAIQHLESKRPNTGKTLPLDSDKMTHQMAESHFNNHVGIVDNPLQIFRHIKDGTVLSHHIEAMNTVYPNVMKNIKDNLMDKMTKFLSENDTDKIPYKTRFSLAHVLGQNLDSTMTQQGIMANQQTLAQNSINQQQQEMAQKGSQQKFSKTGIGKMKTENDETAFQASQMRGR